MASAIRHAAMKSAPEEQIRPPCGLHTALEIPRAVIEATVLPLAWPRLASAPRGDGHPVLLLPGFMASERSLIGLRAYLASRGHAVHTWKQGRNLGLREKTVEALDRLIEQLHERHRRKVSLVGWSLGGLFGLCAAHAAPQRVRSLITLGSPVAPQLGGSSAARPVLALYRAVSFPESPEAHLARAAVRDAISAPPELPISCLYSHSDGVVPVHEARIASTSALHENIAVPGSHPGLGFNPAVLWTVAQRLAQPEDGWRRFVPGPAQAVPAGSRCVPGRA